MRTGAATALGLLLTCALGARGEMQAFLRGSKARLLAGPPPNARHPAPRPTLVLGNMAGDVDTVVSSAAVAFCRARAAAAASAAAGLGGEPPLVVALIPFSRAEFRLRQDASALFRHAGFPLDGEGAPKPLLFADELPDATIAAWRAAAGPGAEPFELVLTDHNRLDPALAARLGSAVVAIIDHHSDEGAHLAGCPTGPFRTIDTSAGSVSSLVSELLPLPDCEAAGPDAAAARQDSAAAAHPDSAAAARPDAAPATRSDCALDPAEPAAELALATLLLGAIALDTRGFAAEAQKWSARDVRAAHRLLARLHGAAGSGGTWAAGRPLPPHATSAADLAAHARWLRADAPLPPSAQVLGATTVKALAAALLDARFDVSALSVADLLALDYKATRADGALRVGVAAVFVPLAELLRRAGGGAALADAMGKFATARGVDALLALTAADDKGAVVRNAARAADGAGADDEPTGLKGAALAPSAAGGGAAAAAVAALAAALEAAPAGLPAALLAEPLFVRQAIDLTGFGLRWEALDGAGALRVSALKRAATRKTVLPVVSYLAAQQQQPQAARADGSAEGARGRAPLS